MKKIRLLQKFVDKKVSISDLCLALWCSERTVYRYKSILESEWPSWFIHGLKWKQSNHNPNTSKFSSIDAIIRKPKFAWFWPTLLAEKLEEIYLITINKESLRQRMVKQWLRVPKKREVIVKRQKRERRPRYWMLVQFDWSYHDWLENWQIKCLLCAIDDATSWDVYAKFADGESFIEVFEFRKEYFMKFWKPEAIYIDCHASYKVNHPSDQFDREMKTRFQRGMESLWVILIYSKQPEWKGRVERWFGTHQDRLVKEMRLHEVRHYDEANDFLEQYYLPKHNSKFSVLPKEEWNNHKKLTKKELDELEWTLAKVSERTVKRDWTICYMNSKYQLPKWQILQQWRKITIKESVYWKIKMFSWFQEIEFLKRA